MARVQDAVNLCEKRHKPQFIGFLDEKEQLYTEKLTSQMGFIYIQAVSVQSP